METSHDNHEYIFFSTSTFQFSSIHFPLLMLYWLSLPDKGNQENFSDCQTLKEKANVKQMKISDRKEIHYTKDNN